MVSLVCYNLKATNIYIFSFNQNQNFSVLGGRSRHEIRFGRRD